MATPQRPPIPAALERLLLVECGHRCAIPTCRQHPVELAHIIPWAQVKVHKFENLIALCPTCHTRYDNGEIDRQSMRTYKLNLLLVHSRYGDLEQRLIRMLVKDRTTDEFWWFADMQILLPYLLDDGLIQDTGKMRKQGGLVQKLYKLTKNGQMYVAQWPTS
jgi:hypothetical protein